MIRTVRTRVARAFTLVEILIVVVILGILAAIVVPSFANAVEPAEQAAFATSLRGFSQSVELYRVREGEFPEDGVSGEIPAGLDDYIDTSTWRRSTPIGGLWDSEADPGGLGYGVGVHFMNDDNPGDAYMTQLDQLFDDGDLETGMFQQFDDDRYYMVLLADD